MIAHVVLCTLRPTLEREARERFARLIRSALEAIPAVRRARVGRRVTIGPPTGVDAGYEYVALLEFDDEAALRCYLEDPAHAELAAMFWSSCARTLVVDYELADPAQPLPELFIR